MTNGADDSLLFKLFMSLLECFFKILSHCFGTCMALCAVVGIVASQQEVVGFESGRGLSAWTCHVLTVFACSVSGYSSFLTQSIYMHVRLVGDSKLSTGMSMQMNGGCAFRWISELSKVCSCLLPIVSPLWPWPGMTRVGNVWMEGRFKLHSIWLPVLIITNTVTLEYSVQNVLITIVFKRQEEMEMVMRRNASMFGKYLF